MEIAFLAFLLSVTVFSIVDLKPDVKARNWPAAAVYMAMMTLAAVLCICLLRRVDLTSQSKIVESIVKAVVPPLD